MIVGKRVPSWELTHPKALLNMILLFQWGDILVSWRVSISKSPLPEVQFFSFVEFHGFYSRRNLKTLNFG